MKPALLFALLIIGVTASGQVAYGIKGGLNLSDIAITNFIDPDAESDYDLKAGLHAGLFVVSPLSDRVDFSVDVLYSNKGVMAINRINLHYAAVALLGRYSLTDALFVEIGPEIGYLVAAKSPYGDVGNTWNNKLDIGLDAGAGFFLSPKFVAAIRYNAGFSSVIDARNSGMADGVKYQNRVLQLSLGYVLNGD